MYQKLVIGGFLGRDPELRYTPEGTPVANFSVATNESFTRRDGSKGDRTTWWRVAAWGRMGEVCNEYLTKGRFVIVEGRMNPDDSGNPRVFQRNDGSYGASYEITAATVKFGPGGNGGGIPADTPEAEVASDEEDPIPF